MGFWTKEVGPSLNSGVLNERDRSFSQQWGFERKGWVLLPTVVFWTKHYLLCLWPVQRRDLAFYNSAIESQWQISETLWIVPQQWGFYRIAENSLFLTKRVNYGQFSLRQYCYNTTFFWKVLEKNEKVRNGQNKVVNHSTRIWKWTIFSEIVFQMLQIWSGESLFYFSVKKSCRLSNEVLRNLRIFSSFLQKKWKFIKKCSLSETYHKEKHFSFLQNVPNKT